MSIIYLVVNSITDITYEMDIKESANHFIMILQMILRRFLRLNDIKPRFMSDQTLIETLVQHPSQKTFDIHGLRLYF